MNLFRAELYRLRTLRSTWVCAAAVLVVGGALAWLVSSTGGDAASVVNGFTATPSALAATAVGAGAVATDRRGSELAQLVIASKSRWSLLGAKYAAVTLWSVGVAVVSAGINAAIAGFPGDYASLTGIVLRGVAVLLCWTTTGFALAGLVGRPWRAVIGVLGWTTLVESAAGIFAPELSRWLPAANSVAAATGPAGTAPQSLTVLSAWTAVLLAVGTLTLRQRDL